MSTRCAVHAARSLNERRPTRPPGRDGQWVFASALLVTALATLVTSRPRPADTPAPAQVAEPFEWALAPAYNSAADVSGTNLSILPVVYPATANILGDPAQPRLNCIRGAVGAQENYFDAKACREVADHLKAKGHTLAVLDYEPDGHGDFAGYTQKNRKVAEQIVDAFFRRGVRLELLYVPDDIAASRWIAKLNGGVVHPAWYAFTEDPQLWAAARERDVAAIRQWHTGAIVGWICPHSVGQSGDGLPALPYGTDVSPEMWQTMMAFCEAHADSAVVWATGWRPDRNVVLPWDPAAAWFQELVTFASGN